MKLPKKVLLAAMLVSTEPVLAVPVQPTEGSTVVFKILKINPSTSLSAASPTTGCAPKIVSWGASNQCLGSVGSQDDGESVSVASSSGFSGVAVFRCDAATNTLTLQPGATCSSAAAPPSPCSSQPVTWAVGGVSCNAIAAAGSHAGTVGVTDNVGAETGSAQFACYSGTYTQVGTATCNAPASCTVTTSMGGVWGAGCQANYSATETISHGSTRTLVDPGPFGYNGSASYVCSNGVMEYQSGTCANTPPPANCTSATRTWAVGAVSCSGTVPATAHGNTSPLVSSTGPNQGQAQFFCNNGTFSVTGTPSCVQPAPAPPPPANCGARSISWFVGSTECTAILGVTNHNAVASVSDTGAPTTGSASFTCNNGTFIQNGGATCTQPALCTTFF